MDGTPFKGRQIVAAIENDGKRRLWICGKEPPRMPRCARDVGALAAGRRGGADPRRSGPQTAERFGENISLRSIAALRDRRPHLYPGWQDRLLDESRQPHVTSTNSQYCESETTTAHEILYVDVHRKKTTMGDEVDF